MSTITITPFAGMLRDLAAQGDKDAAGLLEKIEAEGLGEAA